jgi:hypothetical protein
MARPPLSPRADPDKFAAALAASSSDAIVTHGRAHADDAYGTLMPQGDPSAHNLACTGLAQNSQVGPVVWLNIPIRALKPAQSLGQPCEFYVRPCGILSY